MVMPVINKVPMHGLSHVVHEGIVDNNDGFKYKVPVICLDNFDELNKNEKRITALKIDVENFEYSVLKGGEQLIQKNAPIIYCELWDNENRKKCISLLNNIGYSAFILCKDELVPIEKTTIEKHNFFFIPDSVTD